LAEAINNCVGSSRSHRDILYPKSPLPVET
jgi:hypothetical protein